MSRGITLRFVYSAENFTIYITIINLDHFFHHNGVLRGGDRNICVAPLQGVIDEVHGTPATALVDRMMQMARSMGTAWCTPSMVPTPQSSGDDTQPWPPEDNANTPWPLGSDLNDGVAWPWGMGWTTVAITAKRATSIDITPLTLFQTSSAPSSAPSRRGRLLQFKVRTLPEGHIIDDGPLRLLASGDAPSDIACAIVLVLGLTLRTIAHQSTGNAYIDVIAGCSTNTIPDEIGRIGSPPGDVGHHGLKSISFHWLRMLPALPILAWRDALLVTCIFPLPDQCDVVLFHSRFAQVREVPLQAPQRDITLYCNIRPSNGKVQSLKSAVEFSPTLPPGGSFQGHLPWQSFLKAIHHQTGPIKSAPANIEGTSDKHARALMWVFHYLNHLMSLRHPRKSQVIGLDEIFEFNVTWYHIAQLKILQSYITIINLITSFITTARCEAAIATSVASRQDDTDGLKNDKACLCCPGQSRGDKVLGLPLIYKGMAWCTPSMVPTPQSSGDDTQPWPPEDNANTPWPLGSDLNDGVAWPLGMGWTTVAMYHPADIIPNIVGSFLCAKEARPPFAAQNANTPRSQYRVSPTTQKPIIFDLRGAVLGGELDRGATTGRNCAGAAPRWPTYSPPATRIFPPPDQCDVALFQSGFVPRDFHGKT
ncbi:hypothetical protein BD779DRAFT_1472389 [Infundibulicybe gibba]|nr:hypothetical protein BD779DRAFT_1472389 [Infundibulicybe gibba]